MLWQIKNYEICKIIVYGIYVNTLSDLKKYNIFLRDSSSRP